MFVHFQLPPRPNLANKTGAPALVPAYYDVLFQGAPAKPPQIDLEESRHPEPVSFKYNPLHDLEALWWIACWVIVDKCIRQHGQEYTVTDEQELISYTMFYDQSPKRNKYLIGNTDFQDLVASLHPSLGTAGRILDILRYNLLEAYVAAEKDLASIDHTVADTIHEVFVQSFLDLSYHYQDSGITVHDIQHKTTPGKRGCSDSSGGSNSGLRPMKKLRRALAACLPSTGPASRTRSKGLSA